MCNGSAPITEGVLNNAGDAAAGLYGLRIGLVGPAPPPSGGIAHQTEQLVQLLTAEDAEVEWIVTNAPYRPVLVSRLRGIRALFRLVPFVARLWQVSRKVDLFHVMANSGWSWLLFALPAVLVGWARGIPVVVNYRGGEARSFLQRYGWCVVPFLRMSERVVVPSGFLKEIFSAYGVSVSVIPNVVDVDRFSFRVPDDDVPKYPHLVSTRNLESIYGNDIVLRAFAQLRHRLPEARLTIAGVGPERSDLETLAHELGVNTFVDFCGRLDRSSMAELLESADVMLNASRIDNMPNAILEALAAGVPIVTTDAGGISLIVEHERTALLCQVDDVDGIALQAERAIMNRELARKLAHAGRLEAENYAWSQVRAQWSSVYWAAHGRQTPLMD